MKPGGKGLAIATDSDHDPRDNVVKNLLLHDRRKPLQRLAAWFYQVHNYIPITPGGTSTTPLKAIVSQIAPTLLGPWPANAPRCTAPRNRPVKGWRFCGNTSLWPKLFMCSVP